MTHTYEEALQSSTKYFDGDELAAKVWVDKYALRDINNVLLELNPSDMHLRISSEFARIEKKKFKKPYSERQIFDLLDKFKYIIPQGSPMFGIGNNHQVISLSNCYLLDVPLDSYASILEIDEQLVNISKRRGGVGIDLSNLRPKGSITHNSSRTSTGIVTWMERYSNSIREVGQSGRRGALMLTLSVHHPDILDFATIKNDSTKVTGANISIRLTKEFLDAVDKDEDYQIRFPVDSPNPTYTGLIKARYVWNKIIHSAWLRAEPGLLMWDNVTSNTPADCYDEYESRGTNPCSEINLSPLDSCRLLCLNLYSYVKNPFSKNAEFDHALFIEHTQIAQRLMDDLVDLESEKIKSIIDKVNFDPEPIEVKQRELNMWKRILKFNDEGRRTGTGITALADCLAALGIKYGSEKGKKVVAAIFHNLKMACYKSSIEMAKELGSFTCYDSEKEKDCPYIKQFAKEQPALYADMIEFGRRNICLTTVAPTGTVSIMTQTTSGIEPLFMIGYKRRKKITHDDKNSRVDFTDPTGDKWQEFTVYHPKVKAWMDLTGETDITKSPWFGCCANDINWEARVELQSVMQQHICHAISSTVNLPETVSELDVAKIYEKAFSSNCKGITVYRDNCRTGVLVSNVAQIDDIKKNHAPKRPRQLKCNIHHTVVKGVAYYVAVGILNNDPYEVFVGRNTNSEGDSIVPKSRKSGFIYKKKQGEYVILDLEENPLTTIYSNQCEEHEEALARMTSVALRHGADVHFVTESLLKTRGEMNSFAKSIARSLKEYIKDGTASKEKCPECGNTELKYQEGCKTCSCGFSKCS